jgi:hypothetical protein
MCLSATVVLRVMQSPAEAFDWVEAFQHSQVTVV